MLVPYITYLIYLFIIIFNNISQTNLNHFLDSKFNMSFLSLHTNLSPITKCIYKAYCRNNYNKNVVNVKNEKKFSKYLNVDIIIMFVEISK